MCCVGVPKSKTLDHPNANLRAFIKAELLRYNRTNTNMADVLAIRSLFWTRLRRRGYPPNFLMSVFCDVQPAVCKTIKPKTSHSCDDSIVFSTAFHPHFVHNSKQYRNLIKQCFFKDGKIVFRKTKQLFY